MKWGAPFRPVRFRLAPRMSLTSDVQEFLQTAEKRGVLSIEDLISEAELIAEACFSIDQAESDDGPEMAPAEAVTSVGSGLVVAACIVAILFLSTIVLTIAVISDVVGKVPVAGPMLHDLGESVAGGFKTLTFDACQVVEKEIEVVWRGFRWLFATVAHALGFVVVSELIGEVDKIYKTPSITDKDLQRQINLINETLHRPDTGVLAIQHWYSREISRLFQLVHTLSVEVTGLEQAANGTPTGNAAHLQHEIDVIRATITHIEKQIGAIGTGGPPPKGGTPPNLAKLAAEVAALRVSMTTKIGDVHTDIAHENAEIETIKQRLAHIPPPASAPGVGAHDQHKIDTAFTFATVLAPLAALAPLTAAAVGRIVNVADGECQCVPVGAGIPTFPVDALLADFVMKDGL
jgi:hypothetical protein